MNSAFEAVHLRQVLVDPADGFLPSVVLEISVEIKKLIFDLVTHHEIFSLGLLWLFRALGRLLGFTRVSQVRKRNDFPFQQAGMVGFTPTKVVMSAPAPVKVV